jgi:hypothetical protein
MMPAFGLTASRELLPRFVEVIDTVSASLQVFASWLNAIQTARRNVERHDLRCSRRVGDTGCCRMAW